MISARSSTVKVSHVSTSLQSSSSAFWSASTSFMISRTPFKYAAYWAARGPSGAGFGVRPPCPIKVDVAREIRPGGYFQSVTTRLFLVVATTPALASERGTLLNSGAESLGGHRAGTAR
jgi:hypothetical protein